MVRPIPSNDEARIDLSADPADPFLPTGYFPASGGELPLHAHLFGVCDPGAAKAWAAQGFVAGAAAYPAVQSVGRVGLRSGTVAFFLLCKAVGYLEGCFSCFPRRRFGLLSGRKECMGLGKREGEGFIGNMQKRRHSGPGMPPLLGG